MDGEAVLDGIVAEPCPGACREQRVMGLTRVLGEPGPQDGNGESGERRGPLLAALAHATDVRPGVENDVAVGQADQLGDPQPGLDRERELAWSRRPVRVV